MSKDNSLRFSCARSLFRKGRAEDLPNGQSDDDFLLPSVKNGIGIAEKYRIFSIKCKKNALFLKKEQNGTQAFEKNTVYLPPKRSVIGSLIVWEVALRSDVLTYRLRKARAIYDIFQAFPLNNNIR